MICASEYRFRSTVISFSPGDSSVKWLDSFSSGHLEYPNQVRTIDPQGYPYGEAKNVTIAGDGTGTPFEEKWVNDIFGFFAALLASAGITPSGNPEKVGASDLLDAINTRLGHTRNFIIQPYRLGSGEYSEKSVDVSSEDPAPNGLTFSDDGLTLFMLGESTDTVYQYTLSSPFDISTATYASKSFDASTQGTSMAGMHVTSDGLRMFLASAGVVYAYTLSTAWDISTASYDSVSANVAATTGTIVGLEFNPAGTKMFALSASNDRVYEFDLSTPFDLTTVTYNSVSLDVSSEDTLPTGLWMSRDGKTLLVAGLNSVAVFKYVLTTAFDLSSTSYSNESLSVSGQDSLITCVGADVDGVNVYVGGASNDSIYQYFVGLVRPV